MFSALVFKIVSDRHVGKVGFYQNIFGKLKPAVTFLNSTAEERVGRLVKCMPITGKR